MYVPVSLTDFSTRTGSPRARRRRSSRSAAGRNGPVTMTIEHEHVTEVFTGFGEKGLRSEQVATGAANEAGDPARLIVMRDAGHFEIASPRAATWPRVSSVIGALLEGRLPEQNADEER